jgi:MBG domain (YGX type)/Bacterial Ig domain
MKSFSTLRATAALLAFGVVQALAQPSVSVDQLDYPPFSTVDITGTGFQPGEAVQCQVLRIDVDENSGAEHDPWTIVADANGAFQTAWFVTPDEAGATLRLTATGLTSASTALTVFTDGAVTVSVAPATGGSAILDNTAASGGTGAYTRLTGPALTENGKGTFQTGSIILTAPSGFEFDTTTSSVTATVTGGNLTVRPASSGHGSSQTQVTPTTSTITIWVANKSTDSASTITWSGIRVRPTRQAPLASGNITASGTSEALFTYAAGSSDLNYGPLTEVRSAAASSVIAVAAGQSISYGTPSVSLSGTVSAAGPIYAANGETVSVTINGATQNAVVAGGAGGFSVSFPAATIPASATPYTITYAYAGDASLTAASNTSASLTVTKANLTVTAVPDEKVYDGTPDSAGIPQITSGTLFNGDTAAFTQSFNSKDVLSANTLVPAGSVIDRNGGSNYAITFVSLATHSITPAPLTVAAGDAARVYGAPNPAFSASYSGFVHGEDASVLAGSPSLSTTASSSSPVSGSPYPVTVAQATLSDPNYSFSFTSGKLSVIPAGTTAALSSDKWTVPPSGAVTFSVTASAAAPSIAVPSGSVQFVANGTNSLGAAIALVNGLGSLTIQGSALAHGSNTIIAVFSDAAGNFNGCSSSLIPKQVVNCSPMSGTHTLRTKLNTPITFNASDLSSMDRDPDADPLSVTISNATTDGGGTVAAAGGVITYTPASNFVGGDKLSYTIADPFGGTASCTLNVAVAMGGKTSMINHIVPLPDRNRKLVAFGVPGNSYFIQASTDLVHWTTLSSNVAPDTSVITFMDLTATNYPSRFYRLSTQ